MTPLVLALPWVGILLFLLVRVRWPDELPAGPRPTEGPFVSVVVPARNEARNIEQCVRSLTESDYPSFEVVVVDDRSTDDTAERARRLESGRASRLVVVDGQPLPDGWLGKPWACWQGAEVARGDAILFTDADTTHAPNLLARAVAGLNEERADLLTVLGRQLMGSFWERLVQPQVFFVMLLRFPDFQRTAANDRWRDAIANGQYILMPRSAYDAIDGHRAVQNEVAEDLALAQVVKRAGRRLRIRSAETGLATRMYRSFSELVEGWSKNLHMGGLQTLPPLLRPVAPPLSLLIGLLLWQLPPLALAMSLAGLVGPEVLVWSLVACSVSVLIWVRFSSRMGAGWWYGLLYPLGAAVGAYIFVRSWTRGRNVEWKGRAYRLPSPSDRP